MECYLPSWRRTQRWFKLLPGFKPGEFPNPPGIFDLYGLAPESYRPVPSYKGPSPGIPPVRVPPGPPVCFPHLRPEFIGFSSQVYLTLSI